MQKILAALLTFLAVLWAEESFAQAKQNVLVIHSYNQDHVWEGFLKAGIDETFQEEAHVRIFHEYLDAKRFPDQRHAEDLFTYLNTKYADTRPDLIMVSDDVALQTVLKHRPTSFPDIPLVFMGVNTVSKSLVDMPNTTGVFENRDIGKTILDIKAITAKDELIVISDRETAGLANTAKARQVVGHEDAPARIHFIEELFKNDVVQELNKYSPDVPILLIGQVIDGEAGNALMGWREGTAFLSRQLRNPIFTIGIITMEHGSLGAHNLDGEVHGAQAAQLAQRVLAGTPASDIPDITTAESLWILDWQLMKKFGYSANSFPDNALLVNNDAGFYEQYRALVWGVSVAFAIALVVIVLLVEIIRRGNKTRDILIENEDRYKDLAQVGSIVFWETDALNQFQFASDNFSSFLGIPAEEIAGKPIIGVLQQDTRIDFPVEELRQLIATRRPIENLVLRVRNSVKDLQVFLMNATVTRDKSNQFNGYRGVVKEVTEERQLSQELAYLAAFDAITGLANRTSFYTQLNELLSSDSTANAESFVCFLDLDRFKTVNDTAGHLVGDAMLAEVAKAISSCLQDDDYLGRLGGDEFGLILTNRSPSSALQTCEQIELAVRNCPFHWRDRIFNVGVSIGAVPVLPGLTATELLSKADLACYKAKEAGRGRVYMTDNDHGDLYDEELQMGYVANVSQTLQQNRFFLVKQPICPLDPDGKGAPHYEYLLRYRDEEGNIISPATFVPAAEKHGVIGLIDRWVVERVFSSYKFSFPNEDTLVSINLSGISLSSEKFVDEIEALLKKSRINPANICFEVTETAAISQLNQALSFISQMKAHGIKFALDDFGSGTSSFGYLKQLPVDFVKIDGSLVRNIVSEPTDLAIVSSITSIAHMMGIKTIAEFVETDEIRKLLAETGVDYVQGYAVGKPAL